MKINFKFLLVSLLLVFGVGANGAQDIRLFTIDNRSKGITPKTVEKAFSDAGFVISANNNMNKAFDAKFKTHTHDVLNLMTVHKIQSVEKLISNYPDMALFTPLSMSIFTRKGDHNISVSLMDITGVSKVTGIPIDNKDLVAYMKDVSNVLTEAFPDGKFETVNYAIKEAKGELVNRFSMALDVESDEIEDEIDSIQVELESGLKTSGFVIAGLNSLENDGYDHFDVYSICKVAVFFEVSKRHPEAGAFAPCSFYVYKKKGEMDMNFAYPSIYNWFSSVDIVETESRSVLTKAQKEMNAVVEEVTED